MRLAAVAFAGGALALHGAAALPAVGWLASAGLFAALLGWLARRLTRRGALRAGALALVAAGLAAGWSWSGVLARARMAAIIPSALEGQDLELTGVVADLPQPFERGVRFVFDVESAASGAGPVAFGGRVLLAWYSGLTPTEFQAVLPIRAGERWRFTARLKRPHGNVNPHGFDYEVWLLQARINATGYVRPRAVAARIDARAQGSNSWVQQTRDRIRERLREALPEARYAGVLIALAIGDQRAIAPEDWAVFTRTGVAHLMSISGLHVTMLAALAGALASWGWRRSARLPLVIPARRVAAIAGASAAFAYCLLAGFGIPAQRTLYMLAVAALALWFDRTQSASRVLAAALLAVVILDPFAPLAAGFWLSFVAVAVLLYAAQAGTGALREFVRAQWAITVALAPLTLVLFQQSSLAGILANAVAIPLVSLAVTPLALIAALLPIPGVAWLGHAVVTLLMPLLEWAATLPFAVWQQHAPELWTIPLAAIGAAWLLAPRGMPARYAGAVLLAPLVLVQPAAIPAASARIDVLDVGQGLAVVVRTANHTLVYDAGPAFSPEADAGHRVLAPYLRGEGVRRIDRLMVTHLDNDHAGGAATVAQLLEVDFVHSSLPPAHRAQRDVRYRIPCAAGQQWRWDGVDFAVLHPLAEHYVNPARRTNAASCVLRIAVGDRRVLLTADIEAREEQALVARNGREDLRAEILLAPHHGSATSSTAAFLEAVRPQAILVPAGYRNRFGHPHPNVLERYRAAGAGIWRTDRGGMLRVTFDASGANVEAYRSTAPRYWRQPDENAKVPADP